MTDPATGFQQAAGELDGIELGDDHRRLIPASRIRMDPGTADECDEPRRQGGTVGHECESGAGARSWGPRTPRDAAHEGIARVTQLIRRTNLSLTSL